MNVSCHLCGKEHELFRYVRKTSTEVGFKTQIGFFCDQVPVVRHAKGDTVVVNHLKFVLARSEDLVHVDVPHLPEKFSPAARKQMQGKSQLQFVMTYPDKDEVAAKELEKKISELLAMRNGIREQIVKLEGEMRELQNQIDYGAARLSELKTIPLFK